MAEVVAGHEPAARPGPARQVTDELSLEAVHMTAQRRAAKWLGPRPHAVTVAPRRPPRYAADAVPPGPPKASSLPFCPAE